MYWFHLKEKSTNFNLGPINFNILDRTGLLTLLSVPCPGFFQTFVLRARFSDRNRAPFWGPTTKMGAPKKALFYSAAFFQQSSASGENDLGWGNRSTRTNTRLLIMSKHIQLHYPATGCTVAENYKPMRYTSKAYIKCKIIFLEAKSSYGVHRCWELHGNEMYE